jgi:hypothetical protein
MASVLRRAAYVAAMVTAAIAGFSMLAVVVAPTNAASAFFAVCAMGLGVLTYMLWPKRQPSTPEHGVVGEALAPTALARDGQRRRRRVIVLHAPRRGFFGWVFLLIFLAFNAVMAFALVGFLVEVGKRADQIQATRDYGRTFGAVLISFFWLCGAVITGLLALVTRGRGQHTMIEEDIEQ